MTPEDERIEVRRVIDFRQLLVDAAELLRQARKVSGAPITYKQVEDDLRAVIAELDARGGAG